MQIYLRDRNPSLVRAWEEMFVDCPDVHPSFGDIFAEGPWLNVQAVVSPANSFGFMDGGIDFVYSAYFGWAVSEKLREHLWQEYQGELLVGQALVMDMRETNTKHVAHKTRIERTPYLISAPTMRVPSDVSQTVNAFLAFRAVLREAKKHGIESILCPGLGTSIGQMPYRNCAVQMLEAYRTFENPKFFDVLGNAHTLHYSMLTPDTYKKNVLGEV